MRPIGFSTGAVARGDVRKGLSVLRQHQVRSVELSALRIEELAPLISILPSLTLDDFTFVSIHAPSFFEPALEPYVVDLLDQVRPADLLVVVHPDVIFTPALWAFLGPRLLIENMDRRKSVGRTVRELRPIFDHLPEARFCFDIGHARQIDPTMEEARALLETYGSKLDEVHISEVNSASRHDPISELASEAFQKVARLIPSQVPIILETLVDEGQSSVFAEIRSAERALRWDTVLTA